MDRTAFRSLLCRVLPSCSGFIFQIHLRQRAKHFKLCWPEYHSNLNGCKWFHYQALEGSEQENEAGCGG